MSNTANTFTSMQSMLHEAYSDGVGSHNHPKSKFKKIKTSMRKDYKNSKNACPCVKKQKCGCKIK
jgi:hypothetical protein